MRDELGELNVLKWVLVALLGGWRLLRSGHTAGAGQYTNLKAEQVSFIYPVIAALIDWEYRGAAELLSFEPLN